MLSGCGYEQSCNFGCWLHPILLSNMVEVSSLPVLGAMLTNPAVGHSTSHHQTSTLPITPFSLFE